MTLSQRFIKTGDNFFSRIESRVLEINLSFWWRARFLLILFFLLSTGISPGCLSGWPGSGGSGTFLECCPSHNPGSQGLPPMRLFQVKMPTDYQALCFFEKKNKSLCTCNKMHLQFRTKYSRTKPITQ